MNKPRKITYADLLADRIMDMTASELLQLEEVTQRVVTGMDSEARMDDSEKKIVDFAVSATLYELRKLGQKS